MFEQIRILLDKFMHGDLSETDLSLELEWYMCESNGVVRWD